MRRLRLSWLLILALLAATLAPAQAGWFCATGLPCAIGMARMRNVAAPAAHDCCHKTAAPSCHSSAALTGKRSAQELNAPQGCHYRSAVEADRAFLGSQQAPQVDAPVALLLQAPVVLAPVSAQSPAWAPNPDGYRPPPLRDAGPSRAPPSA